MDRIQPGYQIFGNIWEEKVKNSIHSQKCFILFAILHVFRCYIRVHRYYHILYCIYNIHYTYIMCNVYGIWYICMIWDILLGGCKYSHICTFVTRIHYHPHIFNQHSHLCTLHTHSWCAHLKYIQTFALHTNASLTVLAVHIFVFSIYFERSW